MGRGKSARAFSMLACVFAFAGCGPLIPPTGEMTKPKAFAPEPTLSERRSEHITALPARLPELKGSAACLAGLAASGIEFQALPGSRSGPGCSQIDAVQIVRVAADHHEIAVSNIGPTACQTARAFSGWARFSADRAARQILGQRITTIETMGSYACRNAGVIDQLSAHADVAAIDVVGFVLADGRRISVKRDWQGGDAATREFLRVVHRSACKRFARVLGPEYDAAHIDRFHLGQGSEQLCR